MRIWDREISVRLTQLRNRNATSVPTFLAQSDFQMRKKSRRLSLSVCWESGKMDRCSGNMNESITLMVGRTLVSCERSKSNDRNEFC